MSSILILESACSISYSWATGSPQLRGTFSKIACNGDTSTLSSSVHGLESTRAGDAAAAAAPAGRAGVEALNDGIGLRGGGRDGGGGGDGGADDVNRGGGGGAGGVEFTVVPCSIGLILSATIPQLVSASI